MPESALLTGELEPANEPYAVAKIAGIKLCESFNCQYSTDFRSVMSTNFYGSNDKFHPENSHVVPAMMRRFHEAKQAGSKTVTVWGTGKPKREFLHMDDMAEATVHQFELDKNRYNSHITPACSHINVGTGVDCTIRELFETMAELAEIMADVFGFSGKIVFDSSIEFKAKGEKIVNKNIEKKVNILCLDGRYSTTRTITTRQPVIENNPDDRFESLLFLPKNKDRKGEGGLRTNGFFKISLPDKPLVSVITVVFNGEQFLEEAIQSVISQTYDNVEYIIIDGGSNDGTLDVIKKYEGQIDYWVSEKDAGIYDAMNKGIKLSTGYFIGLVNSDDILYSSVITDIWEMFINDGKTIDYTYGVVDIIKANGELYGYSAPLTESQSSKRLYKEMPYPHLSVFVRRHVYAELGLFDISFKLSGDYDFVLRLYDNGCRGVRLPNIVGAFRQGGRSGGIQTYIETLQVMKKHDVPLWFSIINFVASLSKLMLYKFLSKKIVLFIKRYRVSKHQFY